MALHHYLVSYKLALRGPGSAEGDIQIESSYPLSPEDIDAARATIREHNEKLQVVTVVIVSISPLAPPRSSAVRSALRIAGPVPS